MPSGQSSLSCLDVVRHLRDQRLNPVEFDLAAQPLSESHRNVDSVQLQVVTIEVPSVWRFFCLADDAGND